MTKEHTKELTEILRNLANSESIRPGEVPDIDLYMDQVTHFMEEHLQGKARDEGDKVLTKTMINNYTKKKLLPHPTKKRYTKEHLLLLIFIYYFKDFLSLTDIQTLLDPIIERFFNNDETISVEDIYTETFDLSEERMHALCRDIMETWHTASQSFEDAPEEDRETLQLFSFICMLSFDIYLKKQVIVQLLDEVADPAAGKETKEQEARAEEAR